MSIVAHMIGAALLANSVPHLVHGVSGCDFHSPFAKPPFRGKSSPTSNVLWGGFNFAGGCALLFGVGAFQFGPNIDTVLVFLTGLLVAVGVGRSLQRLRAGER